MGPSGAGVVGVGVRTLNEAGTVGQWAREQVELFCISKLINCVLEPDEEWVFLDFHFAMRKLSWLTSADCLLLLLLLLLHCYCQLSPSWLLLVMLLMLSHLDLMPSLCQ